MGLKQKFGKAKSRVKNLPKEIVKKNIKKEFGQKNLWSNKIVGQKRFWFKKYKGIKKSFRQPLKTENSTT